MARKELQGDFPLQGSGGHASPENCVLFIKIIGGNNLGSSLRNSPVVGF